MKKLIKSLYNRVKYSHLTKDLFNYNPKLGISFSTYKQLSKYRISDVADLKVQFHEREIQFSSPFWFLHSLNEIFVEEVYKFNRSTEKHLILDCGANVGLSTIYLKYIFPNAHIIAFEPDKKIFAQLSDNISKFNLKDVELKDSAIWIENGFVNFDSDQGLGGKINTAGEKTQSLKAIRLHNFLVNKKVFFLKMDIEGAEYSVLKDIEKDLSNVENLFIEFHAEKGKKNKLTEILQIVENAGFEYYIKDAWDNMVHPFTKRNTGGFHLQLNIFCYRIN